MIVNTIVNTNDFSILVYQFIALYQKLPIMQMNPMERFCGTPKNMNILQAFMFDLYHQHK